MGSGLELPPNPNGGESVLQRYYRGGAFSTSFWMMPGRDLVLLLTMHINHGAAGRLFYQIMPSAEPLRSPGPACDGSTNRLRRR
jgi:CubicO group peptidase (beta-lactamase class C family)